jgi:hypothetical protein
MNRVWSLVWLLVIVALGSVGLMYIADWVSTNRLDRRQISVAAVASRMAALVVIERERVRLGQVLREIEAQRSLRGVPVLVMTSKDVRDHQSVINLRGQGIECVLIVTDYDDPYRAVRRVWVGETRVVTMYKNTRPPSAVDSVPVFEAPPVDGGDIFPPS